PAVVLRSSPNCQSRGGRVLMWAATPKIVLLGTALAAVMPIPHARAQGVPHPQAEARALDIEKKAIGSRSVAGPGNRCGGVATLFRDTLIAGEFDTKEIQITPIDDTTYLIATWRGSDPKLKPLVISGHMDVVEAKREDWERDPFVPVVENGYLY